MPREKWEYQIRVFGPEMMEHWDTQLKSTLNRYGQSGWELVALHPDGSAIFKRKKGI